MAPFNCKERGKRVLLRFSAGLYFRPSNSHFGCCCCCLHADLTQIGVKSKFKMKEGRHQTAQQRARNLVLHTHTQEWGLHEHSLAYKTSSSSVGNFASWHIVHFSHAKDCIFCECRETLDVAGSNVHTNDGVLCSLVRIYNSKQFYDSQQHIFCVALIKLCTKRARVLF